MRACLLLLLALPAFGGYGFTAAITTDHTLAGTADSSNFPLVIRNLTGTVNTSGTAVTWVSGDHFVSNEAGKSIRINGTIYAIASYSSSTSITLTGSAGSQTGVAYNTWPELATVANGGQVQHTATVNSHTVPTDFIFTSDVGGSSNLKWEIESYSATTGVFVAWVKIPTLSHTSDVTFYAFYGNSAVSTWQGDVANTWDANYVRVYHFNHDGNQPFDSTAHQDLNTTASDTTGTPLADGAAFNHALTGGTTALPYTNTARTLEVWVNGSSCAVTETLLEYGTTSGSQWQALVLNCGSANITYSGWSDDISITGGWTFATNPSWNYFVGIYDGTKGYLYHQTNLLNAGGTSKSWNTVSSRVFDIDQNGDGTFSFDEVRVSNVARSTSYLTATYNSLTNPATFFTPGAPTVPGGPRHRAISQ